MELKISPDCNEVYIYTFFFLLMSQVCSISFQLQSQAIVSVILHCSRFATPKTAENNPNIRFDFSIQAFLKASRIIFF